MSKSSLCTTTGATSDGSPGELRGLGDAGAGTWAQTILRTSSHAVTAIKQFFILESDAGLRFGFGLVRNEARLLRHWHAKSTDRRSAKRRAIVGAFSRRRLVTRV